MTKLLSNEGLQAKSVEELTDILNDTDRTIQQLSAYQQTVHDIREIKNTQALYSAKVAKMSPNERRALAQALAPAGIISEEQIPEL